MHERCGTVNSVPFISNEKCLKNFISSIKSTDRLLINIDNSGQSFIENISKIHNNITTSNLGNGKSFLSILERSIQERDENDVIYFIENDYLHLPEVEEYIEDGFSTGAHYVTLYDHPDKYTDLYRNLNCQIFAGNKCYWRTTPSTCMTFAAKVKTLRQDFPIIKLFCDTYGPPGDHQMFMALGKNKRVLVSPINSRCTHGESCCIANYINWESL